MATLDRHRAHRILGCLLDTAPELRWHRLEELCERDDALREAVARLLRAAEAPGSLVDPDSGWSDGLWSGLAEEMAGGESALGAGSLIGAYRIVGEIGRGGMAVVYKAERADGELQRAVALKVLKLGLDTEDMVRRFEQERQILADLDHPHIARLFDAGRTRDGRPFFVMELVEGRPIDRYCDAHRLTVEQRLELVCVAAQAVDYAHRHLVVHRDLKPSNILVNDAGEVKLLDFGIAKLLDARAAGTAPELPAQTVRLMTPEYASPEQIRGERVSTASDVYQLGLLLYALLCGRGPYPPAQRTLAELERVICEQPPLRLSEAVLHADGSRAGAAAPGADAIGEARGASTGRLRRRLRGDLETIALKALSKEPGRRYGSADRFAQDLRRHLRGLPVSARADTWFYHARKFVRRHAIGTGAAVVGLGLLAGMALFHTTRIQDERDRARAEAAKALQISQFLTDLFRGADPRVARGTELTARELLDRGAEQVERKLTGQPDVQADLLRVLARTYRELGTYEAADRLLSHALELRRGDVAAAPAQWVGLLIEFGKLRGMQGRFKDARALFEEAVGVPVGTSAAALSESAESLRALGDLLMGQFGEYANAKPMLDRALAIEESVSGESSEAVARILHSLGAFHFEVGDLVQAEQAYARIYRIYQHEFGPKHPLAGTALISLAFVRLEQGELDGLEAMYRQGLEILEHAYGPEHAVVATALNNLATLLIRLGRNDEAIALLQRSLAIRSKASGPQHPGTAYPLAGLGDAHLASGRLSEARDYYARSVAVRGSQPDPRRFDALMLHGLVKLGGIEERLDDPSAAERHLNQALEIWRHAPPSTDPRLASALVPLGRWLVERGRCAEAVPVLRRVAQLPAARQAPGATDADTGTVDDLLARCPTGS